MNAKSARNENVIAAIKNIEEAIRLLEDANEIETLRGHHCGDFLHYASELKEILSCDGGEAGLVNLLSVLQK